MPNGRIVSGAGAGQVKTYTRGPGPNGKIAVKVRALNGATLEISLGSPGGGMDNPDFTGGQVTTTLVPAQVGQYTLKVTIRVNDVVDKELTQQIEVVQG